MKNLSLILISAGALWAWDGWLFVSPGEQNIKTSFSLENQTLDNFIFSWPAIYLFYFPDWLEGPQTGDWMGRTPSFLLLIPTSLSQEKQTL
ncbi:MAG: hypothetical protein ABIN54_07355 [candidate division WOR-3 bacterium]